MAGNLPDTIENQLLDALVGTASYTVTTPIKVALETVAGTDAAAGTECTGGSYVRQTVTFGAASGGSIANSGALSFTSMPACTVVAIAVYDSNGTPKRLAYGALTASKVVASGDTFQIAISALTLALD